MTTQPAPAATPDPPGEPKGRLDRILGDIPRILASKAHIAWLFVLLLWIVILAIFIPSIAPARVELILGNYTNVTSDIGACIAAGGTVQLLRDSHKRNRLVAETHRLLHVVHADHARALGQTPAPPEG
jgi:hypothetical protein